MPFHLVSVFNPLVAQGIEGFPEVAFGRVATSVVTVLDAARPIVSEPRIDFGSPSRRGVRTGSSAARQRR